MPLVGRNPCFHLIKWKAQCWKSEFLNVPGPTACGVCPVPTARILFMTAQASLVLLCNRCMGVEPAPLLLHAGKPTSCELATSWAWVNPAPLGGGVPGDLRHPSALPHCEWFLLFHGGTLSAREWDWWAKLISNTWDRNNIWAFWWVIYTEWANGRQGCGGDKPVLFKSLEGKINKGDARRRCAHMQMNTRGQSMSMNGSSCAIFLCF